MRGDLSKSRGSKQESNSNATKTRKQTRLPCNTTGIKNKQFREMVYQNMKSQKTHQKLEKRLESKQIPLAERIIQVPNTIENTKIENLLEIKNQNDQEIQDLMQTDEFADYFKQPLDYKPKVLITSSKNATSATLNFINALVDFIPNSEYIQRGPSHIIKEIVEGAIERSYTSVIIIGESNKNPSTFLFLLISI